MNETETYLLRLNVIKANIDNKIKRLEKLNENWRKLEVKEVEAAKKLKAIDVGHLLKKEIERDEDLQVLQSQMVELKVVFYGIKVTLII